VRVSLSYILVAGLAACAAHKPGPGTQGRRPVFPDAHTPDFARKPYERFARADVVAIAVREWRLFNKPVDDDPPGTRPPRSADEKPERWPGLWQRVGEYWWLGINANEPETAWTGKHDEFGIEFPASVDGQYAWSAAFVSYVMRIAGAGPRFPYSINHSDYINVAKQMADRQTAGWAIVAERPNAYAPQPGDLICLGRGYGGKLSYDDLPASRFPGHCDIVVQAVPGMLTVIGGNVDDAVTMKHVPTTPDGRLAAPDGTVVDTRYPWMVVVRVLYDALVS
jgi:Uncharacterized protein conserved in bacteria (DUF2272)